MATKKALKKDVRDRIIEHLEVTERNLFWLSKKTEIPYGTLYTCIAKKHFNLSDENLAKINGFLGTDF